MKKVYFKKNLNKSNPLTVIWSGGFFISIYIVYIYACVSIYVNILANIWHVLYEIISISDIIGVLRVFRLLEVHLLTSFLSLFGILWTWSDVNETCWSNSLHERVFGPEYFPPRYIPSVVSYFVGILLVLVLFFVFFLFLILILRHFPLLILILHLFFLCPHCCNHLLWLLVPSHFALFLYFFFFSFFLCFSSPDTFFRPFFFDISTNTTLNICVCS